jgi:hypothetical protein
MAYPSILVMIGYSSQIPTQVRFPRSKTNSYRLDQDIA